LYTIFYGSIYDYLLFWVFIQKNNEILIKFVFGMENAKSFLNQYFYKIYSLEWGKADKELI